MEQLPFVLGLIAVTGLVTPVPTLCLAVANLFCRVLYAVGYAAKGPNFRMIGVVPNIFVIAGLMGLGVNSVF